MFAFIYVSSPSERLALQGENITIAITDEQVSCVLDIKKTLAPSQKQPLKQSTSWSVQKLSVMMMRWEKSFRKKKETKQGLG